MNELRGNKTLIVAGAVVIAALCVSTIAAYSVTAPYIGYTMRGGSNQPCYGGSPSTLETVGHFTLPPSASNIQSQCDLFRANIWFDMTPADLKEFVNSTEVAFPLNSTIMPPPFGPFLAKSASSYLYGEMIGQRDPDTGVSYTQQIWVDITSGIQFSVTLFVTSDLQ